MKNKFISVILATIMVISLVACSKTKTTNVVEETAPIETTTEATTNKVKIGMICLHDENSSYDKNFIDAFKAACEVKGVEGTIKVGIDESNACYEAAVDLVDRGCNIIFGDSFGHEAFLLQAAREFPAVQFCHATGTLAHTENILNYHNAFASIYEGRYIGGVIAGMKLNEMIEAGTITVENAKLGYVSAFPYAECNSGYSAFYLGAKSVCPTATMEVIYTGSWYAEALEKESSLKLISDGCVVIAGHADSMGLPNGATEQNVPFVFYNGDVSTTYPDTYMIATKINWQPYFEYIIDCVINNTPIDTDWVGTFETGSVVMTSVNEKVAPKGAVEKVAELEEKFVKGELNVFDTSTFTVNGEHLTSYKADVDTDEAYTSDTEVIENGIFMESKFRSAPYFDILIDGISTIE